MKFDTSKNPDFRFFDELWGKVSKIVKDFGNFEWNSVIIVFF